MLAPFTPEFYFVEVSAAFPPQAITGNGVAHRLDEPAMQMREAVTIEPQRKLILRLHPAASRSGVVRNGDHRWLFIRLGRARGETK
jgi:hypothetical protein